jgi:hypothetical protein
VVVTHLQAHRQQTGAYPDTLENLGDTVTDPFTTAPFEYERVGDTFALYSAGGVVLSDASPQTVLDAVVHSLIRTVPAGDGNEIVFWPWPATGGWGARPRC